MCPGRERFPDTPVRKDCKSRDSHQFGSRPATSSAIGSRMATLCVFLPTDDVAVATGLAARTCKIPNCSAVAPCLLPCGGKLFSLEADSESRLPRHKRSHRARMLLRAGAAAALLLA